MEWYGSQLLSLQQAERALPLDVAQDWEEQKWIGVHLLPDALFLKSSSVCSASDVSKIWNPDNLFFVSCYVYFVKWTVNSKSNWFVIIMIIIIIALYCATVGGGTAPSWLPAVLNQKEEEEKHCSSATYCGGVCWGVG